MDIQTNKIDKMFKGDIGLVILLTAVVIGIIMFVLFHALRLIGQSTVMIMFIAIAGIACLALLWGMIMVVRHLRLNKQELYSEELRNTINK